jgi:hypothetical protein
LRLSDFKGGMVIQGEKVREAISDPGVKYLYRTNQTNFSVFPGMRLAYWASDSVRQAFSIGMPLEQIASPRRGLQTGNSNKFIRSWWEVNSNQIIADGMGKWVLFNNGGKYRKWYGNVLEVVLWEHNGRAIKQYPKSIVPNEQLYFRKSIVWNKITSARVSSRINIEGWLQGDAAPFAVMNDDSFFEQVLGFLNSKALPALMDVLNETINKQVGDFKKLPIIEVPQDLRHQLISNVRESIRIVKNDWDAYEISFDCEMKFTIGIAEHKPSTILVVLEPDHAEAVAASPPVQTKAA